MKKLIIVSYSYPPSNAPAAQRPYSFAKHLNKDKFDVVVLSCKNQDSSMGVEKNVDFSLKGVELILVNSLKFSKFRKIKKKTMTTKNSQLSNKKSYRVVLLNFLNKLIFPDKAVFWLPYVLSYILFNRSKFKTDIIYSTSPLFTNHLIALFLKRINPNAKFISDFRDYHYIENYEFSDGLKKTLHKRIELITIRKSNNVIFISESMKETYSKRYKIQKEKFVTIYNGFDKDEFLNHKKIDSNKKLTFFYAGSFYKGVRSPKPLLLTLEYLLENELISKNEFTIEIAGNFESELIEDISSLKVFNNINFLGLLSRNEVKEKYIESHVLWLIIGNKVNHYTGIPIKMYEYLGSKRPIINFSPKNSESYNIIKNHNLGWNFDNNENNIKNKANILIEAFIQYRAKKLNLPINSYGIDKFLRGKQSKEFEKLL